MLQPDLFLAFLNSFTFPPSCSINYTGFRSQLLSSSKLLGVAPKYLWYHIRSPLSATSPRPPTSLDWQVLFVPRLGPPWSKLDPSPPLDPAFGIPSLPLFAQPCCLNLFQHPSPFSKSIFYFRGLRTGGALLSGLYHERRFINLEIR